MSLRLRLVLAFLAIAFVMAGLSFFALRQSWRIQHQVADLTSVSIARFEAGRTIGQALEIEGDWRDDGVFEASEFTALSGPRRPKLRGTLQAVEPDAGVVRMYGVTIAVDDSTEYQGSSRTTLAAFAAGERAEISCTIDAQGRWRARKIRVGDLKESDKIKGTVTAVSMDGAAPDSLEISGITIILDVAERFPDPRTELRRITLATRMSLAAQDIGLAARRVLAGNDDTLIAVDGELADARTVLIESVEDLDEAVARAREIAETETAGIGRDGESLQLETALWLDPLQEILAELDTQTSAFLAFASADSVAATSYLNHELEPLVVDRLRPLIHGYMLDAQEGLALEVEHISAQATATAKALLGASAVALIFALGLGFVVWRSISTPLIRLKHAAEEIGRGRLETRVVVSSRDELGVLADTINRMADKLAATTVSIANLDDIFASMAGALFVVSREGAITNVNRAAGTMLGMPPAELVGRSFATVCAEPGFDVQSPAASGEHLLQRNDGTEVAVSLVGAALSGGNGSSRGFVWVAQDLTERKAMEERLRRSLAEKELLLREVHHRVKNNLQVISSLLDLQADRIEDDTARDIYADSQSRIRSMALIHQQLYGSTDLDHIEFGTYLDQLTDSLFRFYGGGREQIAILTDAPPPSRLGIDQALTCGLIINELVTNALKHAFAPGSTGTVTVGFRTGGGRHVLTVADDGIGLPEEHARAGSDSLGMSLVAALVTQLEGQMTVAGSPGTVFTIGFPENGVAPA